MQEKRRLLYSLAHPDDESFGFAGSIAHYVGEGVETHLICATNGDVGSMDDEYMEGFSDVAARRMYELECAAEVLGLTLHTFNYRDSGMQGSPDNEHPQSFVQQDIEEVVGRVVRVIREVRPQVIVTFDPEGGYRHPDHIAIHDATLGAFHLAGDATQYTDQIEAGLSAYQPQKLYYGTFSRKRLRWVVRFAPLVGIDPTRMGRNKDMDFKEIAKIQWPIHVRIPVQDYSDVVQKAWACHASQHLSSSSGGILAWAFRRSTKYDTYMRAHPPVTGRLRERDLFGGVKLSEAGESG